jgi:predicted ester cyclase
MSRIDISILSLVSKNAMPNNRRTMQACPVDKVLEKLSVTTNEAWKLAEHWIAAWNGHDLDLIMTHYEDTVELTSPVAAQLVGTPDGKVIGKANLKAYFRRGLEAYPELQFRLDDVLLGVSSVVLLYTNQKGTHTAEFMELSAAGKVARVVANYSAQKA